MRSTPFERGVRAKRRGRALESNPFARRSGDGNRRRANEWALGWHSVAVCAPVPSDWQWPKLVPFPRPPAGDYEVRERGLLALFRPTDVVEWDVLLNGMVLGIATPPENDSLRIAYSVLCSFVHSRGDQLGDEDDDWIEGSHPLKYLWHAIRIQGPDGHYPPLVVSAYEELCELRNKSAIDEVQNG